jgi:pimeloyl-ACP methyl ester carboxylesterase
MMHVERYGSGPATYAALHGWGGSHRTYAPLAPHVPPAASLFAADLPGYGRSPRLPRPSAEAVGEEVARVVETLGPGRVTLVGNCSGAIFALLAASVNPARIARIVLIDPFAFVPWYFKVFISPSFGRYAYYSTFANPLGRWLTNASLRSKRASSSNLTRSFRQVDHEVSLEYLVMLDALGSIARFDGLRLDTDIAYGERTFGAVKASLPEWRRVLPHARVSSVPGAGHLPIEEAPTRIASILFGNEEGGGR